MPREILITGFGSIGRRHLSNLQSLGHHAIVLYRTGKGALDDTLAAVLPTENDLDSALRRHPLAVIVSNPTALHLSVAIPSAQAGCHLLLEKPISHTLDEVDHLQEVVKAKNLTVLVGFQYRFHPSLQQIKRLLDDQTIGQITSVHVHWGEYLPNWHPWEDFRNGYSARPDLGGGVVLTLCHPLDYLHWLLGEVTEVSAMLGQVSGLDIPVEDTADILLRFDTGAIGHVHLDYIQRPAAHRLQIVGQNGTILWDNADGVVRSFRVDADQWEIFPVPDGFERNKLFLDEMQHFLACITGHETPLCTLDDGVYALRLALAAKQSAAQGKKVIL